MNNRYLHSMPFRSFYGDKVGFTVPGGGAISIDYLKVNYLDKKEDKKTNFIN